MSFMVLFTEKQEGLRRVVWLQQNRQMNKQNDNSVLRCFLLLLFEIGYPGLAPNSLHN